MWLCGHTGWDTLAIRTGHLSVFWLWKFPLSPNFLIVPKWSLLPLSSQRGGGIGTAHTRQGRWQCLSHLCLALVSWVCASTPPFPELLYAHLGHFIFLVANGMIILTFSLETFGSSLKASWCCCASWAPFKLYSSVSCHLPQRLLLNSSSSLWSQFQNLGCPPLEPVQCTEMVGVPFLLFCISQKKVRCSEQHLQYEGGEGLGFSTVALKCYSGGWGIAEAGQRCGGGKG